jgi:hypothetical protein
MELIDYLNNHFLSRDQLLHASGIDGRQLDELIANERMPQPSYRLRVSVACDSFFGAHAEDVAIDYFAKGYPAWIGMLMASQTPAYETFATRYRAALAALPLRSAHPKLNAGVDAHLREEWRHFLAGTYGLCTCSGLPEDIAAKELAICVIQELTGSPLPPGPAGIDTLRTATDLLDRASSPFAPHERARSSRKRYVDEVRLAYGLQA